MSIATGAFANTLTFTQTSTDVLGSVKSDSSTILNGMFIGDIPLSYYSTSITANSPFTLNSAGDWNAGILLFFNNPIRLGDLQSVSIDSTTPMTVNLWLDTGHNGTFFSFDSNGQRTSLNGDGYMRSNPINFLNGSTWFNPILGIGAEGSYTLSQLQSGSLWSINGNTLASLWIGSNSPVAGEQIRSVNVTLADPSAVPEPSSLILLGSGVAGLALLRFRRK
jgi:hypothetical protein